VTLLQFQVLVAVIESKSFTKAAEMLGMTQSAVSQTISSLESALGVKLLIRSRRGITPTKIGERMLLHVREILRLTTLIKQEASASAGLEIGTLRIGSIPSVAAKWLPGVIGSFKNRFPGIELILFEGSHEEVRDWVVNSVVDLGFFTLPCDGVQEIPLLKDNLKVFLPPNHPLNDQPALSLQQIAGDPFIMPKADCESLIREVFAAERLVPNVQFEVRDTATILAMVQEGIGVTLLPELAIPTSLPNVKTSDLIPFAKRSVGLGVRCLQTVPPAGAEFICHTQEYVKKHCADCVSL
jgi:DNA-binding transcriptional LysR family regulator